tara:strand:+ start:2668 stop:2958 length:291 start_codon:yes stop_codon:yes gene_type:complete
MDIYLNRILSYAIKYANDNKKNMITTKHISQAMQHQGGSLDLNGDINFCGGEISQCYDPPKSCMKGGAIIKKRLKSINKKYKISNDAVKMLQSLLI